MEKGYLDEGCSNGNSGDSIDIGIYITKVANMSHWILKRKTIAKSMVQLIIQEVIFLIVMVLWKRWVKLPRWKIKVYTHKWTSMLLVERIIMRTSSEAVSTQITIFMNMKTMFAWRKSSYLSRNYCWSIFFILLKIEWSEMIRN